MEAVALMLIVGSRTLVPLLIFRSPFWGGLAALAADGLDTVTQDALGVSVMSGHYHAFDKAFDLEAAPKLVQEYVMHYEQAQTWHYVKRTIFRWE